MTDFQDLPDGTAVSIQIGDGPWREYVVGQDGFVFSMGLSSNGQDMDYVLSTKLSLWQRFRRWLSSLFDMHLCFDGDLLTPAHPDDPPWYNQPAH